MELVSHVLAALQNGAAVSKQNCQQHVDAESVSAITLWEMKLSGAAQFVLLEFKHFAGSSHVVGDCEHRLALMLD